MFTVQLEFVCYEISRNITICLFQSNGAQAIVSILHDYLYVNKKKTIVQILRNIREFCLSKILLHNN